ncbi:MAG TPA: hypothetical protein VJB16_05265, partial [archaeon]|nr:hypothetical protein [archaeon]
DHNTAILGYMKAAGEKLKLEYELAAHAPAVATIRYPTPAGPDLALFYGVQHCLRAALELYGLPSERAGSIVPVRTEIFHGVPYAVDGLATWESADGLAAELAPDNWPAVAALARSMQRDLTTGERVRSLAIGGKEGARGNLGGHKNPAALEARPA